ncbi:translation elongation factor Ts [Salinivibrio sp. MA427]|uniref:Elongation factor Ts n=1 Tax=Salinivibrio costicola subsp. alcaliphilus TaxID=272773 RepID=A0ABX3KS39_SALCS|nr:MULTISPECIES: translation elongation factor Ts [Salinivibrio]NUY56786.1 elongation factor Ts [Salinivibrio sp. EAGSL]OOE92154.1 translation elongation factor Ts [Salinivibrio sp. AR640]OOE94114.1 translation elongation factor Ts [Salinivibrio sp. AR647]OOF04151.1 translation elongation factor Ts [Salinivibrio sp. MA607]OOF06503.1 translation elongation factor Ts [Salinivibrio sp. MA440]
MATVTAALVKELRERTGAGMMECKKALVEANADIEVAIENMRKSGAAKAAKKAGRVAAEGVILVKENDGKAAIVEINCETDFVAKDANFAAFANQVAETALAEGLAIDALKEKFEQQRAELVAKIGENMDIRRVSFIEGEKVGSYRHGDRIGVVVAAKADEETIKHVAMHIAASKPDYVNPEDVPADVVEKEKKIQVDIAMESGKPADIAEKMVVGRMKKFTGEISLTGQAFVMDPAQTVGQMLKEKGAEVTNFIRFEVGEGIEKEEVDFAAEVAAVQQS